MRKDIKKLLIIIFSIIGLAAIITVVTLVFINAGTNGGGGWGCVIINFQIFDSTINRLINPIFEQLQNFAIFSI